MAPRIIIRFMRGQASGGVTVPRYIFGGHGYSNLMPINAEMLFIRLEINWGSNFVLLANHKLMKPHQGIDRPIDPVY